MSRLLNPIFQETIKDENFYNCLKDNVLKSVNDFENEIPESFTDFNEADYDEILQEIRRIQK
jgi:hypothetical protein